MGYARAGRLYECHHCGRRLISYPMIGDKVRVRFPCGRRTWQWRPEKGRVLAKCRGEMIRRPYTARDFVMAQERAMMAA